MKISTPPQSTSAHPSAAPTGAGHSVQKPPSGSQHVEPTSDPRYRHGNNNSSASDTLPVAQPPASDRADHYKGHKDKDHKSLISDLRKFLHSHLHIGHKGHRPSKSGKHSTSLHQGSNGSHSTSKSKDVARLESYGRWGATLGQGAGGTVRLMRRYQDNELVAVKEFRPMRDDESQSGYRRKALSELCMGAALRHQNVIQTLALFASPSTSSSGLRFWGAMEYAPLDIFAVVMSGHMCRKELYCLFRQIVDGVDYLHSHGLAHRDLKLDNCVLTHSNVLKLIDFGTMTSVTSRPGDSLMNNKVTGVVGSDPYLAPEVLAAPSYDPFKSDVWSLGIIFLSMVLRRFPWRVAHPEKDTSFRLYVQTHPDMAPLPHQSSAHVGDAAELNVVPTSASGPSMALPPMERDTLAQPEPAANSQSSSHSSTDSRSHSSSSDTLSHRRTPHTPPPTPHYHGAHTLQHSNSPISLASSAPTSVAPSRRRSADTDHVKNQSQETLTGAPRAQSHRSLLKVSSHRSMSGVTPVTHHRDRRHSVANPSTRAWNFHEQQHKHHEWQYTHHHVQSSRASETTYKVGSSDSIFRLIPRETRDALKRMLAVHPDRRCSLGYLLRGPLSFEERTEPIHIPSSIDDGQATLRNASVEPQGPRLDSVSDQGDAWLRSITTCALLVQLNGHDGYRHADHPHVQPATPTDNSGEPQPQQTPQQPHRIKKGMFHR